MHPCPRPRSRRSRSQGSGGGSNGGPLAEACETPRDRRDDRLGAGCLGARPAGSRVPDVSLRRSLGLLLREQDDVETAVAEIQVLRIAPGMLVVRTAARQVEHLAVEHLQGFVTALVRAGVVPGVQKQVDFLRAVALLRPCSPSELDWVARGNSRACSRRGGSLRQRIRGRGSATGLSRWRPPSGARRHA